MFFAGLLCAAAVFTIPLGISISSAAETLHSSKGTEFFIIIGLAPLIWASLMVWSGWRLRVTAPVVAEGPYVRVDVVRWTRRPDGCNVGLLNPGDDPASSEPFAVLRLATTQSALQTSGWLCGPAISGTSGPVAVIDSSGSLLGAGRLVDIDAGLARWNRRTSVPPT